MKLKAQPTLLLKVAAFGWFIAFAAFERENASAQVKTRLAIATGGTGGVYYPLGGGLAALISKAPARRRSHRRSNHRIGRQYEAFARQSRGDCLYPAGHGVGCVSGKDQRAE